MNPVSLKPWQMQDAQQLTRIANNKNIWNNVLDNFPNPYTVTDALQWISKENTVSPISKFAIVYHQTIVGSIGMHFNEDVYKNTIELGYFVDEQFWGKGICTEAIKILVLHIQQNALANRIFARVFHHNTASMKALQKSGFFLEGIQQKAAIKNNVLCDVFVWVKLL